MSLKRKMLKYHSLLALVYNEGQRRRMAAAKESCLRRGGRTVRFRLQVAVDETPMRVTVVDRDSGFDDLADAFEDLDVEDLKDWDDEVADMLESAADSEPAKLVNSSFKVHLVFSFGTSTIMITYTSKVSLKRNVFLKKIQCFECFI